MSKEVREIGFHFLAFDKRKPVSQGGGLPFSGLEGKRKVGRGIFGEGTTQSRDDAWL